LLCLMARSPPKKPNCKRCQTSRGGVRAEIALIPRSKRDFNGRQCRSGSCDAAGWAASFSHPQQATPRHRQVSWRLLHRAGIAIGSICAMSPQQPCPICGRKLSDPHHLGFTQPRALGRKVSDEFAVPLCRGRHRVVHRSRDERAWWRQAGIDPIKVARRFWKATHGMGQRWSQRAVITSAAWHCRCRALRDGLAGQTVVQNLEHVRSYWAFERTLIGSVDPRSVTELALVHRRASLF
jgi:hypothetical protein